MKINVSINFDHEKIGQLKKAQQTALEKTVSVILEDVKARGVVPKDTGDLERSGFVDLVDEMVYRIVFDTPYARRWYFNVQGATFQKTKNPNAQDHWMDYYLDGEGLQFVIDTYTKFFKELTDV